MKKLVILFLFFLPLSVMAQEKPDELQKVKDALVTSVIKCQELEKQNADLSALLNRVAEDLKKIETINQLDSLKVVYGIKKPEGGTSVSPSLNKTK